MTEKNIFVHKLFLLLNISDFTLFFMQKLQLPPKKSHPLFFSNPTLKIEILSIPTLFQNLVRGLTPLPSPAERGAGGAHYVPPV